MPSTSVSLAAKCSKPLDSITVVLFDNGSLCYDCSECLYPFYDFRACTRHNCIKQPRTQRRTQWVKCLPVALKAAHRTNAALSKRARTSLCTPVPGLQYSELKLDRLQVSWDLEFFRQCRVCLAVFADARNASAHIIRCAGKYGHKLGEKPSPKNGHGFSPRALKQGRQKVNTTGDVVAVRSKKNDSMWRLAMLLPKEERFSASLMQSVNTVTALSRENIDTSRPTKRQKHERANGIQALLQQPAEDLPLTVDTLEPRLELPRFVKPAQYLKFLQTYFGSAQLSSEGVDELVHYASILAAPADVPALTSFEYLWDSDWLTEMATTLLKLTFEANRVDPIILNSMCSFVTDPTHQLYQSSARTYSFRNVRKDSTLKRYVAVALRPFVLYFTLRFPEVAASLWRSAEEDGSCASSQAQQQECARITFVVSVLEHLMQDVSDSLVSAFVSDFFRVVCLRLRVQSNSQKVLLPSLDAMEKVTSGAMYTIRLFGIAAPYMAGHITSQQEVLQRASSHLLVGFARHKNHLNKINTACKVNHSDVERVYEGTRLVGVAVSGTITAFEAIGALSVRCIQTVRDGIVRVFTVAAKSMDGYEGALLHVRELVKGLEPNHTMAFSNSATHGPTTSVITNSLQDPNFRTLVSQLRARKCQETLWTKYPALREVVVDLIMAIHIRLGFTTRPHEFKTLADTSCQEMYKPWGLKYDYAIHGLLLTFYPSKFNTPGSDGTGLDREVCADTGILLMAIETLFGAPTAVELAQIDFNTELGERLRQAKLGSCCHARQVGVHLFEAIKGDDKASAAEKDQAEAVALSFAHGESTHVGVHYANEADRNDTRVMLRMRSCALGLSGVELPIRRIQGVQSHGRLRNKEDTWRSEAASDGQTLVDIQRWAAESKIPAETHDEAFKCMLDCSLAQVSRKRLRLILVRAHDGYFRIFI